MFLYAWHHRHVRGAKPYAFYLVGQTIWALGYIFELTARQIEAKIFWDSVEWLASVIIPIAFPIFVTRYTNTNYPKLKYLFKLSLITHVFFVIALFTNGYHNLLYPNPSLDTAFIFSELRYKFTWLVYVYGGYAQLVTLISIGILIKSYLQPHNLYRGQILTIILGTLIPVTFSIIILLGVDFTPFRDISPITFAVGNAIVTWGLFRYKLFDVVPIARDLVFDSIEDIVIVLDSQDRVVDINQTALDALRATSSQVLGQPVQKVYESIPQVLERFREPENFHTQISLERKEKLRHYDVRSSMLHDRHGDFIGRIFVATDITEYIEMQEKLRLLNDELEDRVQRRTLELSRSMERYRAVVEHQTEFIVRWKPDRTRTFVNEAYCRYFGLSHEDALATDFLTLIHEEDRLVVLENIKKAEQGEITTSHYTHRVIKANGSIGWNEWIDTAIRNEAGKTIEFQSVGRDITERKQTEQALAYSEEKFYKAFNTTPVMMSVEDNKGIFVDINQSFLNTLGFKKDEVIGRKASDLNIIYNPDDLIVLKKASQEKDSLKDFEIQMQKKTGDIGIILLSSDVFYMDGVKHTVTSGLDITDRKQAQRKLVEAYDTTLEGWAKALELRDKETEGHTRRVTQLTVKLAQACGIPITELDNIRRGAILHDIGKLAISDQILLKSGQLDSDEWRIMSQHPWIGYKLLAPIEFLHASLDIVLYHHEKWDGSGYPKGLKGKDIPLSARIFALIDVWDAVQSERPYKEAWSREEAIAIIKQGSGKHFDPAIVETFLNLILNGGSDRL